MQDEAREPEMHDEGEAGAEQEMHVDVAGEAACKSVAVLCGMKYGDVIRAYVALNGERAVIELLRVDAPDKDDVSYEPGEPITVRVHSVDLIDQMHYAMVHGDELRKDKHKISNRDGDRRKGWQTCYGPSQRRGSTKTKDWRTWTAGRKR